MSHRPITAALGCILGVALLAPAALAQPASVPGPASEEVWEAPVPKGVTRLSELDSGAVYRDPRSSAAVERFYSKAFAGIEGAQCRKIRGKPGIAAGFLCTYTAPLPGGSFEDWTITVQKDPAVGTRITVLSVVRVKGKPPTPEVEFVMPRKGKVYVPRDPLGR